MQTTSESIAEAENGLRRHFPEALTRQPGHEPAAAV
jgi:hypothetical protein